MRALIRNEIDNYKRYILNFKKYYFTLTLLVRKEVVKKYKGSYLGIAWSLLNPLLFMIVLTIIFSTLFNRTIENFPVYLLCGMLLYNFFSTSTNSALKSIISSANLIKKVYFPRYIIVLSKIVSQFIFFVISMLVLVVVILATGADLTIHALFAPLYLVLLFFFCLGASLVLATITVFFRDVEHFYGVLVTALMYASVIFYPEEIIPDQYHIFLDLNPIYYFIKGFRTVVYYGVPIDWLNLLMCLVIAMASLIIGIFVFERNQDKFILYL